MKIIKLCKDNYLEIFALIGARTSFDLEVAREELGIPDIEETFSFLNFNEPSRISSGFIPSSTDILLRVVDGNNNIAPMDRIRLLTDNNKGYILYQKVLSNGGEIWKLHIQFDDLP